MRRSHLRIAALAATLLAGAGCDAARPTAAKGGGDGGAGGVAVGPTDPTPIDVASCTRCHGDPSNGNAAPPMSVRGETATTAMGVGAHQAHLSTTKLRAPLRCDDCHQVPRTVSEQGHMGGPWATVKFDAERSDRLALTGGASPQYVRAADGTSGTCSNVYCHGATLGAGGRNTTPEWTLVDGSQKQCDSCHGAPPTKAGHPAVASDVTKCAGCHPATVDASGKILANGAHMDGKVDAAGGHPAGWSDPSQHGAAANAGGLGSCQTCHGVDLTGGSVGVSCDQCHSSGTPAWRTNCTFCHGDSTRFANPAAPPKGAAGQTATTDRSVGAHQSHLVAGPLAGAIACSECHLVPTNVLDASGQHVDGKREITFGTLARTASAAASFDATGATCATYCHGATLAGGSQKTPAWTGTFAPGQTTLSCTSCHGAPPPTASGVHAKVTQVTQCATCHAATVDATGAVLVAGGKHVNGAVDRANYHPAGWFVAGSGGAHPAAANTAQGAAACVTCHGDVSGTGGYVPVACADCHKAGGTANDFGTAAAASCTGCHGNAALTATPASPLNAAPPRATAGNTRPVGAHQAHLGNTNLRASPIACTECHAVPQSSLHATGAVDLTWGPLAAKAGTPSFNATTLTCATYCHGSPLAAGGSNTAPKWTDTAATATTCGTCHALPPPAPHPTVGATTNCSSCHTGYSGTPGGTTWVVNKAVHMDGKVDAAGAHDQSLAFTQPQNHGLMALDPVVTGGRGPQYCAGCHLGYGSAGTPTASGVTTSDCNACHAANGHASWVNECTFCHGGQDNQTGAPARDHTAVKIANGGASQPTTLVTVGAHTSHVGPTRLGGAALACADCHTVPSGADATVFPGHIDGTPGVTFATGSTARAGGAAPVWSAAAGGSCSATYCHGSTLNASTTRGPTTAPVWTTVNGSQETCGSCHKAPPTTPNHHNAAAVTTCSKCHGGTVQASGALVAGTALHVNGAVDYQGLTCVTCHGNPGNPAPAAGQDAFAAAAPTGGTALDTFGNTVTTQKGVGAHSAHVLGGRSRAVACSECHSGAVPATPTTQASYVHASGTTTVAFGTLARTGAVTPAYAGSGGSCSASYCHGNFAGGASAAPAWTGTFTATPSLGCTSCHGAPPALGTGVFHPPNPNCGSCHTGYTGSTVAAATHVDGTVNVATSGCTSCHGDLSVANVASGDVRAAPAGDASAVDAHGNAATATTSRGVGAHAKHLTSTAFRSAAIACSECHVVPATGDKTHANGTAAITFGTLARTAWAGQPAITPAYNTTSAGCAATYCHGNFKNGANATPVWTVAGTLNCTSCHGAPPAGTHPANATACGNCHDAAYSFNGTTGTVNAAQHMNGAVDLPNMSCTSCHGTTGRGGGTGATGTNPVAAAPPSGTKGETATTQAAVGAHLSHLANTVLRSAPIGCSECHAVPTSTSHATGAVDFAFGPLAKTGGAAPAFNATTNTCSNVYCHGTFTGGANASPSWVGTFAQGATTLGCTSCHGNPPAASTGHVQRDDCGSCHTGYAKTGATTGTVNLANHVNGTVDVVTLACTTCHGTQARANGAGGAAIAGVTYDANQAAAPPLDAQGANTGVLVGVHQAHANPQAAGATYKPLACTECHPNNTSTGHANGTVNLTFAAATGANLGGVTPAFVQGNGTSTATTCTVYCHGSSLSATTTKGARASWAWNGAAAACGDCHLAPPSTANHHNAAAVTTCAKCHGGTVDATGAVLVSGGKHINGTVDTQGLTCTSCHGGTAPPAATGQDANVAAAPTGTGAPDTFGNTGASSAGVGVHVAHVGGARSKPVLCNACHVVPTTPVHKTGAATAGTVTFGNLATTGSIATASYASAGAKTCSNTYCHGNFTGSGLTGAALTTVAWTAAGTLGCNACHGTGTGAAANPPPLPHPQNTSCGTCHGGYTNTTVNQATHVNGVVDQTGTGCTQCHGTPGRTTYAAEAPPIDSHGNTATTSRGVGAHATHLSAGGLSNAIACTECHVVPATGDKAHANGTPLITFGTLAKTGGVTPAFNTTAVSCASVYCHGNFSNGTTANAPVWTGTNQAACGTCHGIPPGGSHPALSAGTNCSGCHTGYN
ncbi:MAG TPA: CxxxxCH/CxxCH domain-containing protein, partial [Anaeromyxobacteraceae bacterium]|nr:CxxxxCH/CxxCH domain-containing protein [Anaeromyxobacteraceae bacterium]